MTEEKSRDQRQKSADAAGTGRRTGGKLQPPGEEPYEPQPFIAERRR